MNLQENMIQAWREQGEVAATDLRQQQTAPGLVRPDFAAGRVADLERAMAEMRRWS